MNETKGKTLKNLIEAWKDGVTKEEFATLATKLTELIAKAEAAVLSRINARVATFKDGQDGRDGRDGVDGRNGTDGRDGRDGVDGRDGANGTDGKDGKDGSPDNGEEIRNKLEAAFLTAEEDEKPKIEIIGHLREELDELKKQLVKATSGGGGQLDVSHWWRNEKFTMDGVDTHVTLAGGVAAGGNAIIVRYQGQTLDMDSHFTVDGNKVTLVGFTPASGDIISVTYQP